MTAERGAKQGKGNPEQADRVVGESDRRALAAQAAGEFKDEISPFALDDHYPDLAPRQIITDSRSISADEGPRAGTTLAVLAKHKPLFRNGQFGRTAPAGNPSQQSDGAGAVLPPSEKAHKQPHLHPPARLTGPPHDETR